MLPSKIIRAAKTRIEKQGWAHGYPGASPGPVCVIVALSDVAGGQYFRCRHFVERAITGDAGGSVYIGRWNDRPERTLDDVYQMLDRAVALASADELDALKNIDANAL